MYLLSVIPNKLSQLLKRALQPCKALNIFSVALSCAAFEFQKVTLHNPFRTEDPNLCELLQEVRYFLPSRPSLTKLMASSVLSKTTEPTNDDILAAAIHFPEFFS